MYTNKLIVYYKALNTSCLWLFIVPPVEETSFTGFYFWTLFSLMIRLMTSTAASCDSEGKRLKINRMAS